MAGAHLDTQARLVVSGLDEDGRSTIVSDADSAVRVATPGFTVCELWQVDRLPTPLMGTSTLGTEPVIDPPPQGLVVRVAAFPPDSEFDPAAYAASLDAFHGEDAHGESAAADGGGLWHQTDTVDVVTVISGEVYAVLEGAETLLKAGDTIVNRGVRHIWSNRTNEPCVVVATMMKGVR
ncbi:MAG: cupin domain-containing protein [Gammaproteobacteria bacterium]